MAILRVYGSYGNNPVHDRVLRAFADGCPEPTEWCDPQDYQPSPVACVFGVAKKAIDFSKFRGRVIAEQKARGLTTVVLESGYLHRGEGEHNYYAVGLNGINGWADFKNINCPSDRWRSLAIDLQPWRPRARTNNYGDAILLAAQIPWDASVQNMNMRTWLERTAKKLRKKTKRPIWYRPHPEAPDWALPAELPGCETVHGNLAHELGNCYAVVTWNSNVGVEALIAGVPVFGLGRGHMYGDCGIPSLRLFPNVRKFPIREPWAANLAYTQWTPGEIAEGKAWRHLFRSRGPIIDAEPPVRANSLMTMVQGFRHAGAF